MPKGKGRVRNSLIKSFRVNDYNHSLPGEVDLKDLSSCQS